MNVNDLRVGNKYEASIMTSTGDYVYDAYLVDNGGLRRNTVISFIDKDYIVGISDYNLSYIFIRLK